MESSRCFPDKDFLSEDGKTKWLRRVLGGNPGAFGGAIHGGFVSRKTCFRDGSIQEFNHSLKG